MFEIYLDSPSPPVSKYGWRGRGKGEEVSMLRNINQIFTFIYAQILHIFPRRLAILTRKSEAVEILSVVPESVVV
jgi:hypothetical protein